MQTGFRILPYIVEKMLHVVLFIFIVNLEHFVICQITAEEVNFWTVIEEHSMEYLQMQEYLRFYPPRYSSKQSILSLK